jgi:hypothetical protein
MERKGTEAMRRAILLFLLWVLSACAAATDPPSPAGTVTHSQTPAAPPETFAPSQTTGPETDGPSNTLPLIADQTERA